MKKETLFKFIKDTYGVEPDYPWFDENGVVRHRDTGKWFGVIMNISAGKLGLNSEKKIDILNTKCDFSLIGSLRGKKGYYPAYHMNKTNWITIDIENVKDDEIKMLLDISYELTKKKTIKNRRG